MVSCDDLATNKAFAEKEQADFPMLSDPDRKAALAYGVVTSPTGLARRWTFYIAPDGTIAKADHVGHTVDAGQTLVATFDELHVPKKH
jgi:peroxiredoxin Q/BCP